MQGLDNPFRAARYHSLVIDKDSCPADLEVTAWTEDGIIMGVQHRQHAHIQVGLSWQGLSKAEHVRHVGKVSAKTNARKAVTSHYSQA